MNPGSSQSIKAFGRLKTK